MPTTTNQSVAISTTSALTMQRTIDAIETQNMTVHPAFTNAWEWGRILLQHFTIHQSDSEGLTYHLTLAQATKLAQFLTRAFPVTLTQNMTVHQAASLAWMVHLLQNFTILAQHKPVGNIILALAENVLLTPEEALQAIYAGTLSETVDLGLLYVNSQGTATTWVINTRTNAVTEYTNYNFNSFAKMGLKYIAANSTGIYELDGDTDNAAPIIADIISGFMQMNGTKLSGLKGLYLAIRGREQFFIKLITGDGREYLYQAVGQPGMMTTKVNVGKGLRSRYLAFQLTSTGQDFDLDSLEFVPMLSDRRV